MYCHYILIHDLLHASLTGSSFLDSRLQKQYCPTNDMIADVLTKLLAHQKFKKFTEVLGHDVNKSHMSQEGVLDVVAVRNAHERCI